MSTDLPLRLRSIERSFPIVSLNPLSVRERNAFKPVYKMHKWFARRSSSIFRAILLGSALPAEGEDGQPLDLMKEFYRGHGDDPRLRRADGSPLRVLDPFMGGGTTVVEALRLGFDVTGVDYNPIAWFIVRGETTPIDLDALDVAYARVAAKVKDELLGLYKTACPLTGKDADIIYGFWVKQGICVDPACGGVTDLFKSYEVARKRGDCTLRYKAEIQCPGCSERFDWELERVTVTAGGPQVAGEKCSGKDRPTGAAYAFGLEEAGVGCPHCGRFVSPDEPGPKAVAKKTVPLHVLVDPSTGDFFEVRGDLPALVTAPVSGFTFDPSSGPVEGPGKFACQRCGRRQAIVQSADANGGPLPFRYYGFYAYTPHTQDHSLSRKAREIGLPTNNDKWFARAAPADLARIQAAAQRLASERVHLPLPTQEIPDGRNFRDLRRQLYRRWEDLYGPRQLLALGLLLRAIAEEPEPPVQEMLLAGFKVALGCMSNLALYNVALSKVERVNSAHDYRNPTSTAEANVWGLDHGRGSFESSLQQVREGISPGSSSWDWREVAGDVVQCPINDGVGRLLPLLKRGSATELKHVEDGSVDLVITDPPYAGSVQYAEMSDWYYVWLHQVLKDVYPDEFGSEITLKSQEIIEDGRTKDATFFFDHLRDAFRECHRVLVDDGLLVFTFHHAENDRWTGLLRSIFEAGFYLVAAYPTHSEALNSIVIQATKGITYDIVHVCRKRLAEPEPAPWSRLRREVQREAREQLAEIERGKDVLPGPDVEMILVGKALRRFSQHYGKVLDGDGLPMNLDEAMERIRLLVREVRGESLPLPGALQEVDSVSQLAFLHVVGKSGWSRDDLHKELRGYAHGLDALLAAGLVREVPKAKGQLEPVPALERGRQRDITKSRTDETLIDVVHGLLARLDAGQPIDEALRLRRGRWVVLGEALSWVGKQDASLRSLTDLAGRRLEALGPDLPVARTEQFALELGGASKGIKGSAS